MKELSVFSVPKEVGSGRIVLALCDAGHLHLGWFAPGDEPDEPTHEVVLTSELALDVGLELIRNGRK